jgi:multidrug efflux pump subunit AcrB
LTSPYEKALTTLVDNIQHIESTTYNGEAIVKVFLQPGASLDTANAQVTAASQYLLRQLPPGTLPPQIINFSASSVPILQLGISGEGLSEAQLNDYATNFIRTQLITVPGAVVPSPYGGKQRQISVNMDQAAMQSKGIAPGDVLNALAQQSVVMPSGTIKIGQSEYDVRTNGSPRTVEALGEYPAQAGQRHHHLSARCGQRQRRLPGADQHRAPGWASRRADFDSEERQCLDAGRGQGHSRDFAARGEHVPPQLKMTPLSDQSIFVRAAVQGVIREAIIAAALTAVMILVFLGSWRSTLIIAISIPLSILTSIIILG